MKDTKSIYNIRMGQNWRSPVEIRDKKLIFNYFDMVGGVDENFNDVN